MFKNRNDNTGFSRYNHNTVTQQCECILNLIPSSIAMKSIKHTALSA